MYINYNIILKAYESLSKIVENNNGKTARERLSGLKYFFATADLLTQKDQESVLISPDAKDDRMEFVASVGRIVKLDDDGGYTNNFIDEFERDQGYKVGNNFLTASLKTNAPYPGRPAPLIIRDNQSVSLSDDFKTNLLEYGDWDSYRIPLSVWLLRFDEFDGDTNDLEALTAQAYIILKERYGLIFDVLLKSADEFKIYMGKFDKPYLVAERPDYFTLLDKKMSAPLTTLATVGENIIFYGAPGTGKSYMLNERSPSNIRTVFHGDYQNSDFVGAYRPYVEGGNVTYKFIPGPYINAFVSAVKEPSKQHYLVIEEINRANSSAVFGEIFQLLDRAPDGRSEYEIDPDLAIKDYLEEALDGEAAWGGKLFLPSNLTLFATMNSADQGVEPLDSAFKRRWKFEYLPIQFDKIGTSDNRRSNNIPYGGREYSWCELASAINKILLNSGLEEDRLLGPYFLSNSDFSDLDKMEKVLCGKVFVYLWDDVLRHSGRDFLFRIDVCKTFNELNSRYKDGERVFSSQLEDLLGYAGPPEEKTEKEG